MQAVYVSFLELQYSGIGESESREQSGMQIYLRLFREMANATRYFQKKSDLTAPELVPIMEA